uniref:Armadillo repeat containing 2 n=1 Tax=Cyprinus carpio TaxID=7962 RepID=A0A8C1T7C2_CYPCA
MELQDKSERVYISTGLRRQTCAEIVSEVRRSLRTLTTRRPFTPQEKHRQLFGESSSRAHDGRPPSAFSLHAQHFEAPDSRPGSGTRLSPLEHKPSLSVSLDEDGGVEDATLPKPPAERGNTRIGSGGSRARLLRAASINRLPPMTPNTKSKKRNKPVEQIGFCLFQKTILIGDAVSDEIVGELCNACSGLHNALAERGMLGRQCKKRSAILRTLFRLIDVGSDRLNLTIAKLILALNVSGNNLLNICKLVFKISRNASNDTLFLNGCILDSLLSLLHCEDVWSKGEAVLYCVGSLKLISGNTALSRLLLSKGFISVLLQLSKRLMHEGEGQHIIAGHILVQVTAALRNIADQSESRPSFLSNKSFSTLCLILENHRSDIDICINVARIFSKLSTYTECCHALAETPRCCSLFLDLLGKYSRKQDLVVRLLFTLGNLTAKCTEARERVYEEEGGIDVLLDLFQVYQETPSPPEQFHASEREDVLVKLIRLLANLAIHPTVGTALAANTLCVQLLLEVLVMSPSRLSFCHCSATKALAELQYGCCFGGHTCVWKSVADQRCETLHHAAQRCETLSLPLFLSRSQEADVVLVFCVSVEQYVVTLLDSKTPDVCFSACGVLINLSADPDNRAMLRAEGTVQKLIDCLRDFGPQDWHLAAVVCQTLWNCYLDGELQHAEELLEILWLYTDRGALQWPSDDGVRQVQEACWELLFLPVAERLRQTPLTHSSSPVCVLACTLCTPKS